MALVGRLKRWRGIALLRRQVRRAPSPASFGELAEKLISLGEIDDALRAAEEGLEVFPDSERLSHVRLFAKKGRMTGEIRRLREDLQRRPHPAAYAQLAQIYRELGSHDDALEIAAECAERFPLNEASYLIQGEIRVERYRRDLIAKDGVIAETALLRVSRLNPHNVTAHLLLAELYWLVGMERECRRHLRQVLTIMPTARSVQEFLRTMEGPEDADPEAESFEYTAEKIEKNCAFVNEPETFPTLQSKGGGARRPAQIDEERITEELSALREHIGLKNAVLLEKDGVVVADFSFEGGLTRAQFSELVAGIRDVADEASRRMDTGALVRAEIEGPGGNVTVARVRGLTVALHYADPLRSESVWEILQDFISRNLNSTREEARA